jgi:glycosyltransferase involved in cell wall biosynthesis
MLESMSVLHVGKFYPPVPGGMETFLRDLLVAQRQRGESASAIVHVGKYPPAAAEAEWLIQVPVWAHWVFAPISPGFPLALWRAIRRRKPDVLHLHLPNPSAFWALFLPAAHRIPWVVHWHSDVVASRLNRGLRLAYPFYRPFEQAVLRQAAVIVVTSPPYLSSSEALRDWHEKCRIIPLGVDGQRLPKVSLSETVGLWEPGCLKILAIGRLTYYKGFDTLLRALATLAQPAQLLIAGEGEERRRLEALIVATGQQQRIRLLGEVDDATRNRLLASCDVFCLPSRERTEAFGIVLMEAMRYGKPVLASHVAGSGMTWVVQDGHNGQLVPCDDVAAWATQLDELAINPTIRQRLGEEGARQFLTRFSIRSVAEQMANLYRAIGEENEDSGAYLGHEEPLIVIPARNEAESILGVLDALRRLGHVDNVMLVDDGSTDATAEIARLAGVMVLSPPLPQGAWGALQTGIRYADRHGYSGVITLDADGQHEPDCIAALLFAARTADVVIGACPERGSPLRKFAWGFFRSLSGFNIEDLTSGFRYYSADACALLAEKEATLLDYQDVGVLLLLRNGGFGIVEIPVTMYPRRSGPSRIFSSWRLVGRYMLETTLLCFANWHPRHLKRR